VQAPVHGLIPVPASVPGITPAGPPISRTDVTEEITETINEEITETVKEDLSKEDPENISLPSPAPREILPLKGGILKIQAISWARDPADRIVVINSKILEQGESIQGYRLVQIKEETVILDHSGQEYELAFDYR
jgi:type II secretory pathway component PulC